MARRVACQAGTCFETKSKPLSMSMSVTLYGCGCFRVGTSSKVVHHFHPHLMMSTKGSRTHYNPSTHNQWYHGVGAPPILVYFSGDWDVHWRYGMLTHGHINPPCFNRNPKKKGETRNKTRRKKREKQKAHVSEPVHSDQQPRVRHLPEQLLLGHAGAASKGCDGCIQLKVVSFCEWFFDGARHGCGVS